MNPEQKQMLRDSLLAAMVVSIPLSLPLGTLRMTARAAGFGLDDDALEAHVDYLVEKGLAQMNRNELSAGVRRWKATAAAVDYCEANGLT
jgi:hypothetical protein